MRILIHKIIKKGLNIYFKHQIRYLISTVLDQDPSINKFKPFESSPIIVIGMHRSGTTLLSNILQESGVFMGNLNSLYTNESLFFQSLNEALFKFSHAFWDQPKPLEEALKSQEIISFFVAIIKKILCSWSFFFYKPNFAKHLHNNLLLWGWKDPRNTYTLPIWINLFPNAKIIHIYRNGIDVSNSLSKRAKIISSKKGDTSLKCWNLEQSLDLWKDYINKVNENLMPISNANKLEICYEKLNLNPKTEIARLLKFLNLEMETSKKKKIYEMFNPNRAFAFKNNEGQCSFYNKHKDDILFKKLKYANI